MKEKRKMNEIGVIFDLDGTLFDTAPLIIKANREYLQRFGIEYTNEFHYRHLGSTLEKMVEVYKEEFNLIVDVDDYRASINEIQFQVLEEMKLDSELYDFLLNLKNNNIKLIVATASSGYRARKILETFNILDLFIDVITKEDVSSHKPDPEVFLLAAKKINVSSKNCVVFEDSQPGIDAAKNAKMKSICVKRFHDGNCVGQDLVIKSYSEVSLDLIKNLLK